METKLRAAKIVLEAGAQLVIAQGARASVLYDIMEGKPAGTRFKRA